MRIAAWFSYNGEPFSGFARQNGQLTVQGNIEDALELLFRRRIDTTCAGRTDAGVHALCQVISFDLLPDEWFRRKPDSLLKSLNALTHEEISFRSVRPMPEDFSARFSAVMREYRYYICTDVAAPLLMEKFCWHLGKPLDVEAMKQASTHLLGEHDFKSFCMAVSAKDKPTHRYVADISFKQEQIWNSNFIVITVIGNAFLHSMVRTMVGTLVLVGRGKRTPEWVGEVLAARNRQAAGQNAPAEGLVLWHVTYDEQHFYYDPRPSGLRGELASDQHLSDAIEDIPSVLTAEEPASKAVKEAPKASMEKDKKSSKKAKKRTNAAESSPAARWARWRQEKEQDREIVIPRGPNLDESTTGEIPFVAAPIEEETQATLFDSTVAPADSAASSSTNGSVLTDVLDADAHVASGAAPAVEGPPIIERKTITVPEVKRSQLQNCFTHHRLQHLNLLRVRCSLRRTNHDLPNVLLSIFRRYTQAHMPLDMRPQRKLLQSLPRNRERNRCQQQCFHRLPRVLVAAHVICVKDSGSVPQTALIPPYAPHPISVQIL